MIMSFLEALRLSKNGSWAAQDLRMGGRRDSAQFSAAFSGLPSRERLGTAEFGKTHDRKRPDGGVKPWAGTTPVLGGTVRPKPARLRSSRLGGRSRPRFDTSPGQMAGSRTCGE